MDDGFGDPNAEESEGEFGSIEDDESVEDFAEESGTTSPETLLQNVLNMLTAQANASIAQANAEAEKARALQAEYTAKATEAGVSQQEELMRMELAKEEGKRKEKEAKRLADLARFRVSAAADLATPSTPNTFESFSIGLRQLDEIEMFATPQSIARERASIMMQYQIDPNDDDETKKYKQLMKSKALQALSVNMQQAQLQQRYKKEVKQKAVMQQQQNNQQNNPNNRNQQGAPNQPIQANQPNNQNNGAFR
jgi:hypothetical protein